MKWPWSSTPEPRKRETKSFVLGTTDALGKFLILGSAGATTASSALSLFQQSTAVSVPINMIADAFSVVGLAVQIDDKIIFDHPVLTFLTQPSPFYDQELFLNVITKDYLVTGEAMIVALGNVNRPPLQLQPISPSASSPSATQNSDAPTSWIVSGRTLPGTYAATPSVTAPRVRYLLVDSNLREFHQIRNYSPRNNSLLRGQSLLVAAAREARSHIMGTEHNVSILEQGGRVSLAFHFEEDMDEEDFEATRDAIIARYSGAQNAGTVGVTAGGKLNIEELGKTPKDMDFAGLQQLAKKSIAQQYKVPLPLISDERQTLNNFAIGNLAFYDQAVLPVARAVLGGLSRLLMPRYGLDPRRARLIVNQDTVTALVQRRNEELQKRKQIAIETINELRAFIGREPVEGGDILYQPAALVPVGTDLFTDDNAPGVREQTLGGASDKPDTDVQPPEDPLPEEMPTPDDDEDEE